MKITIMTNTLLLLCPGIVPLVSNINLYDIVISIYSLKCLVFELLILSFSSSYLVLIMPLNTTVKNRIKGIERIGPHSKDIVSIIFGSLLGDAHAEKRKNGNGTRITFFQEATHVKYLSWMHNQFAIAGYCNPVIPKIGQRLGKNNKVRQIVRFATWTYDSFNWIHEIWYVNDVKVVPQSIGNYLTPLALAIWIMDDGSKVSKGLKLCTNSYSYSDCLLLVQVLHSNFGLKATIQSTGASSQYIIYIWKESMDKLRNIVDPFIIPEMKYKILP